MGVYGTEALVSLQGSWSLRKSQVSFMRRRHRFAGGQVPLTQAVFKMKIQNFVFFSTSWINKMEFFFVNIAYIKLEPLFVHSPC